MFCNKRRNWWIVATVSVVVAIVFGLVIHIPVTQAEEPLEFTVYWSGRSTTLTQSEEFASWNGDVLGITRSENKLFNDLSFSSICIWLHRLEDDEMKTTAHCYSKFMDADNDYFMMENMGGWKLLYGTGKFKGITGAGESHSWLSNQRRPIRQGTSQGRISLKGTFELPKSE
jgi:hypothetical protein